GHSVLANARTLPHNTTRSPPLAGLTQYTPVQEPAPGETAVRTGMNLLLWATHVTEEHFPLLGKLKKTGFDGVEIPLFAGDAAHYRKLRKELDGAGLACTAVTTAKLEANPISPDPGLRQAGLDHLKWAVEMTQILGGD